MTGTRRIAAPLAALALLAALAALLACDRLPGADGDTPDGTGGVADADASGATYRLVFAEFGPTEDRVYLAPPTALGERELVATVPHAPGWAITPAPAMAGDLTAFTALPPDGPPSRDEPADLWLLDVRTGVLTRLAGDADLLAAPVFDPGGGALLYRRTDADGGQELVRVDLATRARRAVHRESGAFGVYPVALEADGAALYFELSTRGTDLYRVREGSEPEHIAHASDHVARDWRLSPDGSALAYLAPEVSAERVVHRAHVVALTPGAAPRAVASEAPGAVLASQFAPVWTPDGGAITVGVEAFPDPSAPAVTLALDGGAGDALPAPERGFDAPLGWSPDGRRLAVRAFDGRDAAEPGRESLAVIEPGGVRRVAASAAELIHIGWLRDE